MIRTRAHALQAFRCARPIPFRTDRGTMQSYDHYPIDGATVLRAEGGPNINGVLSFDLPVLPFPIGQPRAVVVVRVSKLADAQTELGFAVRTAENASKTNAATVATAWAARGGLVALPIDWISVRAMRPNATHWFVQAQMANVVQGNISVNFSAGIAPDS
jgi:hypothetical protein